MPTVAQFHDFFRRAILTNPSRGGKCVVTRAVNALPPDTQASIIEQVRTFRATSTKIMTPMGNTISGRLKW